MEQEKLYVIEEKTHKTLIYKEMHLQITSIFFTKNKSNRLVNNSQPAIISDSKSSVALKKIHVHVTSDPQTNCYNTTQSGTHKH